MPNDFPQLFELIKLNSGIGRSELLNLSGSVDNNLFHSQIRYLLDQGLITEFKEKLYPNIRFIGVYLKNSDDMIKEIILNDIIASDLYHVIPAHDNDPLYFDGYEIDDSNKSFFEKSNNIQFEFDHYEYYLLCSIGNAEQVPHDQPDSGA